ncbi:MAG: lysylphosphatidylglycerol synthase transmembrane domain-containing protein [bacterium]|nr:lysylphosphatidylglycerol synthase transmembrane domain-containing protein [bacterium]
MKRKLIIGSIISGAFFYLAVRDVNWSILGSVLRQTHVGYFALSITVGLINVVARAWRWKFIMLPIKRISTASLLSATFIGLMANNLLPARLGEIVRAYVIGRKESVSRTASFATIVYERIVDVFSLLALLWVSLMFSSGPAWLQRTGWWLLTVNILGIISLYLMERHQAAVSRVFERALSPLPGRFRDRAVTATRSFTVGLATLSRTDTILPIILLSALVWVTAAFALWACLPAVGIHLPFVASVTLLVLVSLGSMIPSAPAYIGVTQYACIVGLATYGIPKSEALAYSLLFHAGTFFPVTIIGLTLLGREGLRFSDLSSSR